MIYLQELSKFLTCPSALLLWGYLKKFVYKKTVYTEITKLIVRKMLKLFIPVYEVV